MRSLDAGRLFVLLRHRRPAAVLHRPRALLRGRRLRPTAALWGAPAAASPPTRRCGPPWTSSRWAASSRSSSPTASRCSTCRSCCSTGAGSYDPAAALESLPDALRETHPAHDPVGPPAAARAPRSTWTAGGRACSRRYFAARLHAVFDSMLNLNPDERVAALEANFDTLRLRADRKTAGAWPTVS